MGRDSELSSPQNKLKDIFHTIFKRHDASQVAGELTPARVCHENAPATPTGPDAIPTSEYAATAATAYGDLEQSAEPLAAPQQLQDQGPHQQKSCSSHKSDSSLTLDSNGAAAPAVADASATPLEPQQQLPSGSDPAVALTQPQCTAPFTPHAAADVSLCVLGHSTSSSDGAGTDAEPAHAGVSCTYTQASSEQRTTQHSSAKALQDGLHVSHEPNPAAADAKAYTNPDCIPYTAAGASESAQQDPLQQQEHAWHQLACPATTMHSEPAPNGSSAGGKPGGQRKVLCASVDDLYQELFGDVPLPSASSSAAQSPYGGHLSSIRGLSSMSPMTTNSAFCHQQAAAAAIAGSGGMPGMGAFIPSAAGSPGPCMNHGMGGSYEGGSRGSPYGTVGGAFEDCGDAGTPVQQPAVMDDMLPPGAFPPRIRTVAVPPPNPSRFSGSDGCSSSSQFADDTPSCCSSSAGGMAWPAVSTEEGTSLGGSVAVSSMSSARGWGSRGSLRYSSPQTHNGHHSLQQSSREGASPSAAGADRAGHQQRHIGHNPAGSMSAPGSAEGKPAPKSTLRARWSNWINGSSSAGGTSGPSPSSLKQLQVQQQQDEQGTEAPEPSAPWLAHSQAGTGPNPGAAAYAQSAPGNAAALTLHNSMAGAYGGSSSAAGASAAPLHQLMHCHSNPELVHSAASGLGGLPGRAHFQRTSALGGNVPPCARALFGSVPQMERPLMMAGSVGNGGSNSSSGWLCGPGGVGFGVLPRSESFPVLSTLDDAVSVASADEEVIRQVNADNVLSSAWGPGSHSASGAGGQSAGGAHPLASHPKLLAFKYCCATSPLNHPGRASPFNSTRNSPFNSPRGTREAIIDMVPLRTAVAAAATAASSCPGSPLGPRHSNTFSSIHTSTPAAAASMAGVAASAVAAAAAAHSKASQQQQQQQPSVLKKQGSSNSQQQLEDLAAAAAAGTCSQQLDSSLSVTSELATACSSSGDSNSSSKPPLQSRTTRGLLCTPPPPVLPLRQQSPAAAAAAAPAAEAVSGTPGSSCAAADTAEGGAAGPSSDGSVLNMQPGRGAACSTGPSSSSSRVESAGYGSSSSRRASAPSGLSAIVMRFSSSGGGSGNKCSSKPEEAHQDSGLVGTTAAASGGGEGSEAEHMEPPPAAVMTRSGSSSHSRAGSAHSAPPLPLPLASSIDVSSPKALQQQQSGGAPGGPDSRCSPRRQSSSRLGASGFTTPSRLSHNSTMAEALVNGSGGAGVGGFALQRTSSCCSSSSGWPGAGAEGNRSCGRSSNSYSVHALPGHDGGLLSTTSVPLPNVYSGTTRSVNSSDSSDGSWAAAGPEAASGSATTASQDHHHQQQQRTAGGQAVAAAQPAAAGVDRYGSCNGASDISAADAQECAYPSWCSSSSWSLLISDRHKQQQHQQQQSQHQQVESGQRQQAETSAEQAAAAAANRTLTAQQDTVGWSAGDGCDEEQAGPIPPSLPEVDFLEKIGRGSFGDVFKGVWCGSVVAVKVIQVKQPSALTFPNRPPTSHQQRSPGADLRSHLLGDAAAAETAATAGPSEIDSQAAQVALELAQHEYESWLNANLRHPNIVQLFTSFTIGLQEHTPAVPMLSCGGECDMSRGALQVLGEAGGSGGLSWKTHLVMEYCELGTMQDLLQRGVFSQGALPPSCHSCWVLATAKEFCTAVAYLHSMDVVHGDLKSSNVLLKAAGVTPWDSRGFVAKVSDFGLSRVMDAISAANGDPPLTPSAAASPDLTNDAADSIPRADSAAAAAPASAAAAGGGSGGVTGAGGSLGWGQPCQPRFGALSHAAPELIRGEALSKASDVYSVGVLLWELLTGQAPFYGMHPGELLSRKLSQHTSQLLHFPPSTPPCLVQLCLDCWADEPARRPTMAAVVQRINDLAVTLLGQQQAVAMFPDVAASLAAQRRQAAMAASAAAAAGGSAGR